MKKIMFTLILIFSIHMISYAQDDFNINSAYDEDGNPIRLQMSDEEWVKEQERLRSEGYLTIFDTEAYHNGDYYIGEDGRVYLGNSPKDYEPRPTTKEERAEIEFDWHRGIVTSADRIAPTRELGLFVTNQLFSDYLFRSRMGSLIGKLDYHTIDDREGIDAVITYLLPGRSRINCYINRFDKIHYIDVIIAASFEDDQDILSMDDLTTIVLQATGLPYGWDDIYSAVKSINDRNFWNGWLYGMTATVEPTTASAIIRIMSPYDFNDDDPYEVMNEFEGECDPNYIGACIPVSARNLNCSDVRMRNFFVVGTDKHKFDGDKNGVCCEPYPFE